MGKLAASLSFLFIIYCSPAFAQPGTGGTYVDSPSYWGCPDGSFSWDLDLSDMTVLSTHSVVTIAAPDCLSKTVDGGSGLPGTFNDYSAACIYISPLR